MSRNYWSQWGNDDLDSCRGKGYLYDDYDPDDDIYEPEESAEEEKGCSCGYYCFDCLGISWRDFM